MHVIDEQAAYAFVLAQGRNIETQVYQRRYPTFNYGATVPVVTEGNQWAIGTTFFTVDTAGEAKFLSGAAADMPFNTVTRGQQSHDFAMIGSGWEWNLEEIEQGILYGLNLNATKALSAADRIERKLNDIAMVGADEKNWTGFVNNPGISRIDAATVSGSTFWADKDVDEILADFNAALGAIRENTLEIEWADTVRIPPSAFRDIATRRLGPGDGMITLLEYLRRNNVYTAETAQPLDIMPLRELETAGAGGTGRMVVYRRDREVLRFHLPMPRSVLQARQKAIMAWETGIIARTGGTEWRLPGAALYMDGITGEEIS